jgi:hypothetical protein
MKPILFVIALSVSACTDEEVDSSEYAIDTNHSGTFDCADLDLVYACIDHHVADACELGDVNHDGVINDHDVQLVHTALHDSGVSCSDPTHH